MADAHFLFAASVTVHDAGSALAWLADAECLLRTYVATFRAGDPCQLSLILRTPGALAPDVADFLERRVRELRERMAALCVFEAPPAWGVTVVVGNAAHPMGAGRRFIVLPTPVLSQEDLFALFLAQVDASRIPAYEVAAVVDNYDLEKVLARRAAGQVFAEPTGVNGRHNLLDFVIDRADPDLSVLDVGCGAGGFYALLRGMARCGVAPMPRYVGIDYARQQVFRARANYPGGDFRTGSAVRLPFADDTFDVTMVLSVFPFIPSVDQAKAVRECLRVARHGMFGAFLVAAADNPFTAEEGCPIIDYGFARFNGAPHSLSVLSPETARGILGEVDEKATWTTETFYFQRRAGQGGRFIQDAEAPEYQGAELTMRLSDPATARTSGDGAARGLLVAGVAGAEELFRLERWHVYPKDWHHRRAELVDHGVDNFRYLEPWGAAAPAVGHPAEAVQ